MQRKAFEKFITLVFFKRTINSLCKRSVHKYANFSFIVIFSLNLIQKHAHDKKMNKIIKCIKNG